MELLLWRWSTAVQVTSAVMIAVFFLALVREDSRAELRWWARAWLFNLAAMSVTLVFWYLEPQNAGVWFPLVRGAYISTKTLFVLLLLQGAWALVRPGATLFSMRQRRIAFATLFVVGSAVPSVALVGIIQCMIMATLLAAGAIFLVRHGEPGIPFLAAGLATRAALASIETITYFSQLVPILPLEWSDRSGTFLSATSSIDTGAEWLIALGCVLSVAQRTQAELRKNNDRLLEAQEDLRRLVDRDPLTGLDNRRGLPQLLRRVQPTGATLLFFDIDFFKRINDLHGHQVGDECLKRFATALRECFRPDDAVLRFGGDEFLVVARGMDEAGADERIQRLRERLRKAVGHVPFFSFSVGVSTLEAGGDPEAALEAADQRMYKTKGRMGI